MTCEWIHRDKSRCEKDTIDGHFCVRHAYEVKRYGGSQKRLQKELKFIEEGCEKCIDIRKNLNICASCNWVIKQYPVKNKTGIYHEGCYEKNNQKKIPVCPVCCEKITREKYFEKEGVFVHKNCYQFGKSCYECNEPLIEDYFKITAFVHRDCFRSHSDDMPSHSAQEAQ